MNAYDEVLYPSHPHPQTHPDRLATIGALFGLKPAPVGRCRVLELGCGNGSNLVPMAWSCPESEFLGLDLATRPIASGQQMIRELGVKNATLRAQSILELTPGFQEFDYIIAHGFYSWVPANVREHLLAICRGCLAPHGIAFVSYGAYPGCHLRHMIREMMLFHVQGIDSPEQRMQQATALLRFLSEAQNVSDEYRQWMKTELEQTLKYDPGHLYHDDLAAVNQPFYFTQFVEQARQHQLQFVGEADFFEMSDHIFAPPIRQTLEKLARSRVLREQYLDFLKCRRFRQTLLCPGAAELDQTASSRAVQRFLISSTLTCRTIPVDLRPGNPASFEPPRGAKIETDFDLGKASLVLLNEATPAGLWFDDLLGQSRARLEQAKIPISDDPDSADALARFFLQLYGAGVVEFRTSLPRAAWAISERPVANPVARWQANRGRVVTSAFHIAVQIEDELGQHLLTLLDGTRDRTALAAELLHFLEKKGALTDRGTAREKFAQQLESNLLKLARFGLLSE